VTRAEFGRELRRLVKLAGFDPLKVKIEFWKPLDREHEGDCRRYAQVYAHNFRFQFTSAILSLPERHRLGLLAHEVGHVIAIRRHGDMSEDGADDRSRDVLGITIGYDMSWPGKGLQYARKIRRPSVSTA
jgi:hypothetical protein